MGRMGETVLARLGTYRRSTGLIGGLPVVLWTIPTVVTVGLYGPSGVLYPPVLMAMTIHGLWVLGQVAGAWRIHRNPLSAERYPRLVGWFLALGAVFLLVNLAGTVVAPPATPIESLGWLSFSWNMGSGIGLLVGLVEARAIDRAVRAEREATEAELRAAQRDRFEYMNALLRHEVLNNVQVIQGQAEYLLTGDQDDETAHALETISRQSQDMADVVEDIRVISEGLERSDLEPIDLGFVLRSELTDVRDTYDGVETDLDLPAEDVRVRADGLLARVFSNLFANGVEHSEADVPEVSVTVETDPETVTVHVADNGPGVPESVRRSLFDQSRGPHGVGLYLVDALVSHYGGDVELLETGAEGSVFAVTLPRVGADGGVEAVTALGADADLEAGTDVRANAADAADDDAAPDDEDATVPRSSANSSHSSVANRED